MDVNDKIDWLFQSILEDTVEEPARDKLTLNRKNYADIAPGTRVYINQEYLIEYSN